MKRGAFFCSTAILGLGIAQLANAQLIIVPTWDASINNDVNAATIKSTINSAIAIYRQRFSNNMTVNITFQEGSGLGGSSTFYGSVYYAAYRAALVSHATTANDTIALNNMAAGTNNPLNGATTVDIATANAGALGFSGFDIASDSTITLNTSIMNLNRVSIDSSKYDQRPSQCTRSMKLWDGVPS